MVVQQDLNKQADKVRREEWNKMVMIVGVISTPEEATEIESITKSFVVAARAKALALKLKRG